MSKTSSLFSALLCTFIWGTTFIAQDTGMDDIGPFTFNAVRFFVGFLAVAPLAFIFERKNINKLLNTYVKTDAYAFNASDREKMLSEIINSNIDEILEAEKMVGDILDTDMKDFVFKKEIS